jgi:hypothetical protein
MPYNFIKNHNYSYGSSYMQKTKYKTMKKPVLSCPHLVTLNHSFRHGFAATYLASKKPIFAAFGMPLGGS